MERKAAPVVDLKATGPASSGSFEAAVAVFGNVDSGGDRMISGAFEKTLRAPPEGRGLPPVVWSHLWGVVPIGSSSEAAEVQGYETAKGQKVDAFVVAGDLFVDEHQTAKEVYTAMARKGGDGLPVLRDWSFGYAATEQLTKKDEAFESIEAKHVRDLIQVDLYEVGPTLVGMNAEAGLGDVKSLGRTSLKHLLEELKVGARNSASDKEMLQEIHDLTGELGVDCAKGRAVPATRGSVAQAVFKAVADAPGVKGWDDIDSYAIYLLTSMIDAGSHFILGEEDDADVARMRTLLLEITAMLADEIAEVEGDSGAVADAIEEAALPTSGREQKRDRPAKRRGGVPTEELNRILAAGPLPATANLA